MTEWFEIVALVLVIGFGLLLFVMLSIRNDRERRKKEAADRRELIEFMMSELKKHRKEYRAIVESDLRYPKYDPFARFYEVRWKGKK